MRVLLGLYPRSWRRRYEPEFLEVLQAEPFSFGRAADVARGAIDAHMHPQVPDAEGRIRPLWKEVLMATLTLSSGLTVLGLALPLVFFVVSMTNPTLMNDGMLMFWGTAFATGLLIGRWWAPAPFFVITAGYVIANGGSLQYPGWMLTMLFMWTTLSITGALIRGAIGEAVAYRTSPR